jgi:hypothetical protein
MTDEMGGVTMFGAPDQEVETETLEGIKEKVRQCLRTLYDRDAMLFERNSGRGVCERCLVFRFAMYLQEVFPEFFVDCDYNSAVENGRDLRGKPITNRDGTTTKRFVDIIVHKRRTVGQSDFICFEIKKWNNNCQQDSMKDRNNLRVLTSEYRYQYGFHLVLGRTLQTAKWTIFQHGQIFEEQRVVFSRGPFS